jgi:hypothetical protein
MSLLFGIAFIVGAVFWNPSFPWITFAIVVGFFFLPFKKILARFPGTQPEGRINPPFRSKRPTE